MIKDFKVLDGDWYTWTEICDECGEKYLTSGDWKVSTDKDRFNDRDHLCLYHLRAKVDKAIAGMKWIQKGKNLRNHLERFHDIEKD